MYKWDPQVREACQALQYLVMSIEAVIECAYATCIVLTLHDLKARILDKLKVSHPIKSVKSAALHDDQRDCDRVTCVGVLLHNFETRNPANQRLEALGLCHV